MKLSGALFLELQQLTDESTNQIVNNYYIQRSNQEINRPWR